VNQNNGSVPVSNMCSLSKLQQMTSGIDSVQPCNTPPTGSVNNLTPPPNHHTHGAMTPSPSSHLLNHNHSASVGARNIATPPTASIQSQMSAAALSYHHKYYPPNMNMAAAATSIPPPTQNSGRTSRNTASAPIQHAAASRVSPNVATTINPSLMQPYGGLNGYRMAAAAAAQQSPGAVTSYMTNPSGFINNSQIPVQMMNMQSQYQDQAALQRAQQNSMYPSYPYLSLNGSMRR
jgi:histone acetyltransferase MYST4